MMQVDVEIHGLDELDNKLADMANELAEKSLYQSLMFATLPMMKEAKSKAPATLQPYKRYMSHGQGKSRRAKRGEGKYVIQQAGLLRKNIKRTKAKRIQNGAGVGIYIPIKRKKIGNSAFYWHMVEYGTSKMPANPFLRPAFHNKKEEAVTRFGKKLKKAIDKYTEN